MSRAAIVVKLIIRQIVATLLCLIVLWTLSSVLVIGEKLPGTPITVGDVLRILAALVLCYLVYGFLGPLFQLYANYLGSKAPVAVAVTRNLLLLVVLAILYGQFKGLAIAAAAPYLARRTASIAYDIVFLIAGVLVTYGIVKELTRVPGE